MHHKRTCQGLISRTLQIWPPSLTQPADKIITLIIASQCRGRVVRTMNRKMIHNSSSWKQAFWRDVHPITKIQVTWLSQRKSQTTTTPATVVRRATFRGSSCRAKRTSTSTSLLSRVRTLADHLRQRVVNLVVTTLAARPMIRIRVLSKAEVKANVVKMSSCRAFQQLAYLAITDLQ